MQELSEKDLLVPISIEGPEQILDVLGVKGYFEVVKGLSEFVVLQGS